MAPLKPTLFVLSPLEPPRWNRSAPPGSDLPGSDLPGSDLLGPDLLGPDVCLAAGFLPREGELVLNTRGGSLNRSVSGAVMSSTRKSYFYAAFSNDSLHSCELQDRAGNNHLIDMCEDPHPGRSLLSFQLLLLNAVRVLWMKSLVFSFLLTLRAALR